MERPTHEPESHRDTFWARVGAVIVDAVLVGIVAGSVAGLFAAAPVRSASISSGLGAVLTFAYFTYMEATYGQTLGKKLLGIVVVTTDGGACETGDAVVRNLLRFVDALPFAYLLGGIVLLVSDDDQRLGDLAADTVVARVAKD